MHAGDLKQPANYTLVIKNLVLHHSKHPITKELKDSAPFFLFKIRKKKVDKALYNLGLDPETTATYAEMKQLIAESSPRSTPSLCQQDSVDTNK